MNKPIEITQLTCHQCGHSWNPRKRFVSQCPNRKCQSKKWNEYPSLSKCCKAEVLSAVDPAKGGYLYCDECKTMLDLFTYAPLIKEDNGTT